MCFFGRGPGRRQWMDGTDVPRPWIRSLLSPSVPWVRTPTEFNVPSPCIWNLRADMNTETTYCKQSTRWHRARLETTPRFFIISTYRITSLCPSWPLAMTKSWRRPCSRSCVHCLCKYESLWVDKTIVCESNATGWMLDRLYTLPFVCEFSTLSNRRLYVIFLYIYIYNYKYLYFRCRHGRNLWRLWMKLVFYRNTLYVVCHLLRRHLLPDLAVCMWERGALDSASVGVKCILMT